MLYAPPGVSLQGAEVARFETQGGVVVFAPAPEFRDENTAIAERVAPLLAPPVEQHADVPLVRAREHIRVFVVEDHPVVREGLRKVLEADGDIAVCGVAQTLGEASASLPESHAGVIVCDLHLPDADEAEAVRRLAGRGAPLVVFTVDTTADVVQAALRAGARGYIPKRSSPEELRAAIRAVASGILAVHPDVLPGIQMGHVAQIEHDSLEPARHDAAPATKDALTPRDLEYLRYLAEGYTNKAIAATMVLAEDTVKKGIQGLIAKMGAADRTHAVVLALRHRLIE